MHCIRPTGTLAVSFFSTLWPISAPRTLGLRRWGKYAVFFGKPLPSHPVKNRLSHPIHFVQKEGISLSMKWKGWSNKVMTGRGLYWDDQNKSPSPPFFPHRKSYIAQSQIPFHYISTHYCSAQFVPMHKTIMCLFINTCSNTMQIFSSTVTTAGQLFTGKLAITTCKLPITVSPIFMLIRAA